MESPRPNLLLILVDQMRADCLGAEGRVDIDTPNLDFLASRGSRFRHAYSPVPSCVPARASLLTGLDQWRAGRLGMGPGSPGIPCDYPHTLPGELRRAGYQTQLIGKGHFSPPEATMGFEHLALDESARHEALGRVDDYRRWFREHAPEGVSPDDHGVDHNSWHARPWHTSEHLHPTAWTMTQGLEFLRTRDRSRPFFLNLSFARPHSPYVPPEYYYRLYEGRIVPPAVGAWAAENAAAGDPADPNAWRARLPERYWTRARMGYFGEISFIDAQIGRLLRLLQKDEADTWRNTWIVFASDHGDMLGDHHLWRKTYAYEASARIPLVVVAPEAAGRRQRAVIDEPVELRDLMPTLLEAAGVPIPPTVTGASLLPGLTRPPAAWRPYVHGEHCTCYAPEQEMQFVTDGRRKFVWLPRVGIERFFDLEADPDECTDLRSSARHAAEVSWWRAQLIRELQQRDCGWCRDGDLSCIDAPLISPYEGKRYDGPSQADVRPPFPPSPPTEPHS